MLPLLLTFKNEAGRVFTFNPAQISVIDHAKRRIIVGVYQFQLTEGEFAGVLAHLQGLLVAAEEAGQSEPEPAVSKLHLPA